MAITIQKIAEDDNKQTILLKGVTEIFGNTIRRMIIEEVPTLAVETVEFKENNSALYDEMLALRLGLTPIKTDLTSYRLPKNQDEIDEKSASCTLTLKLKSSKKGNVYADEAESMDPKCTFAFPKMPLVKLIGKQKIDLTMTAIMGQGKEHVKWASGMAYYNKEPLISVDKIKDPQLIADHSTDSVFTLKGNKLEINKELAYTSKLLNYYSELGVTIDYSENLIYTVESWGQLTCKEMLITSAKMLIEKAEALEKEL